MFSTEIMNFTNSLGVIIHLSAASPGVDPGDICGHSAGFADFCHQFFVRDGGIGPLLHF